MADESDYLLKEIDEDLRQERYQKLWKAYGHYAVGGALALVLSVAGYQGWRTWDLNTRHAEGERFAAAQRLAAADRGAEALAAFAGLSADAGAGYALLARFRSAGLQARAGYPAQATMTYRGIAEDSGVAKTYRELAVILGAIQELNLPRTEGDALVQRLGPLTAADNPWRHSARELTALAHRRAGRLKEALGLYRTIAEDAEAPRSMRSRATEMSAILGK